MGAKKTHKAAAGRLMRVFFFLKGRAARFFGLRGAAGTLDNAAIPFRAETPPPPYRPPMPNPIHWDNSLGPTPLMPQMQRNAALLASTGPVEPPWPPDPNALHAEMIERIEALERAIADLREQQRQGIGHNNPPEPIELTPPLSAQELLDEVEEDMAVLKKQPPAAYPPSPEATAAVTRLAKFGAYLVKLGDIYLTAVVKEAGKRSVQSPFWLTIIYELPKLADLAQQWLQSLR